VHRVFLDAASLCTVTWSSDGRASVRSVNDTAEQGEDDQRDRRGDGRERRLQRVRELQVVQRHAQHADEDHAERAAEVAAVDGREEQGSVQPRGIAAEVVVPGALQASRDQRLHREQQAREKDQHRDDDVERLRRRGQQQHAARRPTEDADGAEAQEPAALPDVLRAEADDAPEIAGPLGDGVGDVRRDGRQAQRHERGEEDQ
jgi:hypothetical protein